ncbi:MAG: hypothetical protein H0T42_27865 [Deltaproteobacteria bacterium]|nr:hypothetical protein [Deltaproteobacteria bacterium]
MANPPGVALAVVAAFVVGCGGGTTKPTTGQLSNSTTSAKGQPSSTALFTINVDSLGPITGKTPANLTALRALLGRDGYEVKPVNNSGVEYHVFLKDELLFYVIPNDDGTLFNVHVVSGKVEIAQHPQWKIAAPFVGDDVLTHCECWGAHPVCFKKGDHVAVAFKRACDGLDDERMRKVLTGVTLQRAIWSPTPFGFDDESGTPDPCGGSLTTPGSVIPAGADPCAGP